MSVWAPAESASADRLWRELESVARQEGVDLEIRPAEAPPPGAWVPVGPERRAVPRPER
jgi:hypothetical protein